MCQDDSYVREMLRAASNMQIATLVACAVGVFVTAITNGCVCERIARIEAEADIKSIYEGSKKGE